jgi:hypothetical protein
MARFQVHHSQDACTIHIEGDRRRPEPSTAVITFPGGSVEVCRTSDGTYWVHVARTNERHAIPDDPARCEGVIVDSRIDYAYGAAARYPGPAIPPMPAAADIDHLAIRVARKTTAA